MKNSSKKWEKHECWAKIKRKLIFLNIGYILHNSLNFWIHLWKIMTVHINYDIGVKTDHWLSTSFIQQALTKHTTHIA